MDLRLGAPDRRKSPRGAPHGEPRRPQLVSLILGAFHEMPGLTLHLEQAARLFGVTPTTCRVVLDDLSRDGILHTTADGQYRLP